MSDESRRPKDANTTVVAESVRSAGASGDIKLPMLVVVWCAKEPSRDGEILLVPPGRPHVLGRGGGDDPRQARVVFVRQRPGSFETMPPLGSTGISRRQLVLERTQRGINVDSVGKCMMEINGERRTSALLGPGDLLSLRRELLLLCVERSAAIPASKLFSRERIGPFGEADALGIIGESPAVWRLREMLAFAADANAHVLLLGESGTGKELAARAIHTLSDRASRPFIARNAATLPRGIVDAELFGNAKNYPNPGMAERRGLIGDADRGTLFLDEIGELSAELQAHLLRVLDGRGEYQRLGESTVRTSDFRLVAATNRPVDSLKHDFAARFTTSVEVPSVAARREDVPLLVRHLIARAAERAPRIASRFVFRDDAGQLLARVDQRVIEHLLSSEPLPTNVRALDAFLWRCMADSEGDVLELPLALRSASDVERTGPNDDDELTADAIKVALEENDWNVPSAARSLGLSSRYALYRLMKKLGIEGPSDR